MGVVTIVLPIRTYSELNQRGHWTKRARRFGEQRFIAKTLAREAFGYYPLSHKVPGALSKWAVKLVRVSPGTLDDDNLRGALKAVRDGIADALGVDDGGFCVRWEYHQEKGKCHEVRVEIEPGRGGA